MRPPRRKVVYRGPVFNIEEWRIPKTGTRYARLVGPDTVCVLPIMKNGKLLLERQYRHSLDKYLYEVPAGHMNKGERPADAARRELEEETGYLAKRLTHMFNMYEAPGSHSEFLYSYLAQNLEKTEERKEIDEIIEIVEVSRQEALRMIKTNRISDAKTISSILFYLTFIRK